MSIEEFIDRGVQLRQTIDIVAGIISALILFIYTLCARYKNTLKKLLELLDLGL